MILYSCDMCGQKIKKEQLRYDLKIEIKAAYDKLEINLLDLMRDSKEEYDKLIQKINDENIDPEKLQADIYKKFEFHLCRDCQQRYIRSPMPVMQYDIKKRLHKRLKEDNS